MHLGGSSRLPASAALAAAAVALALALQGCGLFGGGGGGSPTPSPVPTSPPPPAPTVRWNLDPINVTGQHLYNSKTGEQFHMIGIGFPNVGNDLKEWIRVLQRIKTLGPNINTIRIYEPPGCASWEQVGCFEPFMREADKLGVYVMVAGSGMSWGYFPNDESKCKPATPQGCYKQGNVLGYGRNIIRNFNFPNTLGIVIANEMERDGPSQTLSNIKLLPTLKAYARDLKSYMTMCDSHGDSPTKGRMRQIPLVYAAIDLGDHLYDEADYLFCDAFNSSIDIFGLNVERWVSDRGGREEYNKINSKVAEKQWPGAFVHTEEGGPLVDIFRRSWMQIPGFFENWHSIDGFLAYTYNGNTDFNMFDGPTADATEMVDGIRFFDYLKNVGKLPADVNRPVKRPVCKSSITVDDYGQQYPLIDFRTVQVYDTGDNGWAQNCPAAWQAADVSDVVV